MLAGDGPAIVRSIQLVRTSAPVYHIEVHGQHVYQVGELGLLVHNSCPEDALKALAKKLRLNITSPTTRVLLENANTTVSTFIGKYRQSRILRELPSDVLDMPLSEALTHSSKVRKLLTDARFLKSNTHG